MRVLIVGCGYVGLPLGIELARQGHEVNGIRRRPGSEPDLCAAGITPIIVDITQAKGLAKIPANYDWVVNCVSSAGGKIQDYEAVYLQGTRNLVAWLAAAPPKKFVYTSSTSVYGQIDGSQVTEETSTASASVTGQILLQTERVLLDAFKGRAFPAIILRVSGIYGLGRGYWFRQYLEGNARIEGEGERILNMVHRDDVVGSVMAALTKGEPGECYNVVDDEPVAQIAFFQWISDRFGGPLPPSQSPSERTSRKRALTNKRVCNEKLKRKLGYLLRYPTFRDGYEAEIVSLKNLPNRSLLGNQVKRPERKSE